jgi:archaemetzincin
MSAMTLAPAFRAVRLVAICGLFLLFSLPARAASPYTVCLQPLGSYEVSLLAPIKRGIAQTYGFDVRTLVAHALPAAAFYPPRQRYRADRVLDVLKPQRKVRSCDFVLGFTAADVSTRKGAHEDWGVLGLSYLGERVSVVSTFRMHRGADQPLLERRAVKVSLHEIGHAIGLAHRSEGPSCLMNDAGGAIATIDRASGKLCPGEQAEVRRKVAPDSWFKFLN